MSRIGYGRNMAHDTSPAYDTDPHSGAEVLLEKRGHVGLVTLNAPQRLNTISGPMLEGISAALLAAEHDRNIRCIVLTGAGRAFCAGLDLADQSKGNGTLGVLDDAGISAEFDLRSAPPVVLHNIDTPVICALNGGAAGYGFDLALGADIRIAATGIKLNPGFAKRGILPESGGTWLLPRIVGYARAAEITMVGRTLLAEEALEMGLVNRVVAPDRLLAEAMDTADAIAGNAPLAVRAIKRMMRAAETETFEQNIHHVYLQLLPLFRSRDFKEGVAAYLEKRDPSFEGR